MISVKDTTTGSSLMFDAAAKYLQFLAQMDIDMARNKGVVSYVAVP